MGVHKRACDAAYDLVFVVEQNRDGQMRTLLINELQTTQLSWWRFYISQGCLFPLIISMYKLALITKNTS